MFFERIYEKGLAHASYFVGCQATGTGVVIDPKRDIDDYLALAAREGMEITHIAETHIHADYLSGSLELAGKTGAELLLSDEGGEDWQYEFEHRGLRDGDEFMVGRLRFEVLHTPGHTPEHVSFLLTDVPAGDPPLMIFTGDFVFVGDVGRPDLLEEAAGFAGTKVKGAEQMFASLGRFKALPDHIQVWPAHGAGSACGKALGAMPASTVGYEKLVNWALQYGDREEFVEDLLEGQPEPPFYFAQMKKLNKISRPILDEIPSPRRLSSAELERARKGGLIVDARPNSSYARRHIPGSLNIQNGNSLSTYAGWVLDYDRPFVLVAPDDMREEVVRRLVRIGLDNIEGYVPDLEDWVESGGKVESVPRMKPRELDAALGEGEVELLDVRGYSEFESERIRGAKNLHFGYLTRRLEEIPRDRTVVLQCQTGNRSSIAYGLLKREGFANLVDLPGGLDRWKGAGFPVESAPSATTVS